VTSTGVCIEKEENGAPKIVTVTSIEGNIDWGLLKEFYRRVILTQRAALAFLREHNLLDTVHQMMIILCRKKFGELFIYCICLWEIKGKLKESLFSSGTAILGTTEFSSSRKLKVFDSKQRKFSSRWDANLQIKIPLGGFPKMSTSFCFWVQWSQVSGELTKRDKTAEKLASHRLQNSTEN